jgi:hypothetical protein
MLTLAGMPCDHEQVFDVDGVHEDKHFLGGASSSWLAVPYLDRVPTLISPEETVLIHVIRHPKDFIESVLRMGFFEAHAPEKYSEYLSFAVGKAGIYDQWLHQTSEIDVAARFWLLWNKMIEDRYRDFAGVVPWRIEYPQSGLLDALGLPATSKDVEETWQNKREWFVESSIPQQVTLDDIEDDELREQVISACSDYGYNPNRGKTPNVYWAALLERQVSHYSVNSLLDLASDAATRGYQRLSVPYGRTDYVRNEIVRRFIDKSTCSQDVLVMVDNDHLFPPGMLTKLASHNKPVVAALAFRRSRPFDPLFYRDVDGRLVNPAEWEEGALYEADAVGTGVIAIKRWVFTELERQGQRFPYFRYNYDQGPMSWKSTEDIWFARMCGKAGIQMYCDTSVIIPHESAKFVDHRTWYKFRQDHPDISVRVEE